MRPKKGSSHLAFFAELAAILVVGLGGSYIAQRMSLIDQTLHAMLVLLVLWGSYLFAVGSVLVRILRNKEKDADS